MKTSAFQRAILVTTGEGEFTVLFEPISRVRAEPAETSGLPQAAIDLFVDGCDEGLPN